jgi:hypothetical protein
MLMKCTKALIYNGKRYRIGDEFEVARGQDARILAAIRKAERVPEAGGGAVVPVPAFEAPRVKRKYTRRDMVADDKNGTPAKVPDELPDQE